MNGLKMSGLEMALTTIASGKIAREKDSTPDSADILVDCERDRQAANDSDADGRGSKSDLKNKIKKTKH